LYSTVYARLRRHQRIVSVVHGLSQSLQGTERMNSSYCVLLYLKFPEHGNVKTRLANTLGHTHAVALYRCFIVDILAMLRNAAQNGESDACICYAPESAEQAFREWLGTAYGYFPQHGHDLGERMGDSFRQAFEAGYTKAILIGSDLPDLPAEHITTAFAQLDTHDVVIGPTDDGGYYLIGFRKDSFCPGIFQGISWSTDTVYARTLKNIHAVNCACGELPEWSDVDIEDDLRQLVARNRQSARALRTMAYLRQHQIGNSF
jgi:uncharacterized protein